MSDIFHVLPYISSGDLSRKWALTHSICIRPSDTAPCSYSPSLWICSSAIHKPKASLRSCLPRWHLNLLNIPSSQHRLSRNSREGLVAFPVLPTMIASQSRVDTQLECTSLGYNCLWKVVFLSTGWHLIYIDPSVFLIAPLPEAPIYWVITMWQAWCQVLWLNIISFNPHKDTRRLEMDIVSILQMRKQRLRELRLTC